MPFLELEVIRNKARYFRELLILIYAPGTKEPSGYKVPAAKIWYPVPLLERSKRRERVGLRASRRMMGMKFFNDLFIHEDIYECTSCVIQDNG